MGHRKSTSGRNSVYTQNRRGMLIGGQPSIPCHRPLSHSSPVRQPSKPPRKVLWGNGGNRSHNSGIDDRPSPHFCIPRDAGSAAWSENFSHLNRSSISLSLSSDGGSSVSSANSAHSKCGNSGVNKKPVARPSNPLRYKTELCRSFEESGECRFGSSCTFAHGLRELRAVLRHPRYKTDLCRTYHGAGYCQYGARCHFVHDPEEAAGVAAMRGHRLRTSPDGANMTMLALPENSDISSNVYASDLILANLQRLHAYKLVEEKIGFLNTSGYGSDQLDSTGTLSPESNSVSLDMLTIGQDSLLGMTSNLQPLENVCRTPLDMPGSSSAKYNINTKSPERLNNQIWRLPPVGGNWLDREPELCTQSSLSDLNTVNYSSAPRSNMWNLCGASTERKSVIENPMEVSRNLLIPSISELIHMP